MSVSAGSDPWIDRVARNVANRNDGGAGEPRSFGVFDRILGRITPPLRAGGDVTFTTVTRNRIAGRLRLGTSGLLFDSQVGGTTDSSATLRALDGRELVSVRVDARDAVVSYGGGVATARMTRAEIDALNITRPNPPAAAAPPTLAARPTQARAAPGPARVPAGMLQGDLRVVRELYRSREYALWPQLSYALGLAGATGHKHRPSLTLHALGMSAAVVLAVDPSRPALSYRYKLPPHLRRPNLRALFDRIAPTDCWSREEGPNHELLPACQADTPCESYPNRDEDCFGMCGPGCSDCWDWVCGDCCYHDFCADHDWLLRECENSNDVIACVNSVVIILQRVVGCDYWWEDLF